ncbi:hypothetical protein HK101_005800 [Irineochytrium annulatum]|nr:hypothetical protein HK101_005800 [Irineochytrium annulatum]
MTSTTNALTAKTCAKKAKMAPTKARRAHKIKDKSHQTKRPASLPPKPRRPRLQKFGKPSKAATKEFPCRWCGSDSHPTCAKCENCYGFGHDAAACVSLNTAKHKIYIFKQSIVYGRDKMKPVSPSNPCRYCGSTEHPVCVKCSTCFGFGHDPPRCPSHDWKKRQPIQSGPVVAQFDAEDDMDISDQEKAPLDTTIVEAAQPQSSKTQPLTHMVIAEQEAAKVASFMHIPGKTEPVICSADALIDPSATQTIGNDRAQFETLEAVDGLEFQGADGDVTGRGVLVVRDEEGNEIKVKSAVLIPTSTHVVLAGRGLLRAGFDARMTMRDREGPEERVVREWVHHLTWDALVAEEKPNGIMSMTVLYMKSE